MGELSAIIRQLMQTPLKRTPYPKGYPDDLKFDLYPGKDYVVGVLDEMIEDFTRLLFEADGEKAELVADYLNLFQDLREQRLSQLKEAGMV